MNELLIEIGQYGVFGLVLAWSLYRNEKLTERLFNVVENNTKAMQGIYNTLDKCEKKTEY